jgi:hypothetical protein
MTELTGALAAHTHQWIVAWGTPADPRRAHLKCACGATRQPARIPGQIRIQVLVRAGYRCQDCGAFGTGGHPIELQHLRYYGECHCNRPDKCHCDIRPIFGRETLDDLAALCRGCHHARHVDPSGEFWPDPQEMAEYWEAYYWAISKGG